MLIAQTALLASMVMLQGKPLQHLVRTVARGSIGREQEDPVQHPARPADRVSTGIL